MSATDDYLAEVEQREQAATPGPWLPDGLDINGDYFVRTGYTSASDVGFTESDAEFIAHARTDVPRLVEALRGALAWADLQARPFPDGIPDREGEAVAAGLRDAITEALGGQS